MKYIINNNTYYIGKNARENWDLYDKAEPFDIWFHLDKESSPHVFLELRNNDEPNLETILEGAKLCKQFSKKKNSTNVNVIYCPKEYIYKGKFVGEIIIKNNIKTIKV